MITKDEMLLNINKRIEILEAMKSDFEHQKQFLKDFNDTEEEIIKRNLANDEEFLFAVKNDRNRNFIHIHFRKISASLCSKLIHI